MGRRPEAYRRGLQGVSVEKVPGQLEAPENR